LYNSQKAIIFSLSKLKHNNNTKTTNIMKRNEIIEKVCKVCGKNSEMCHIWDDGWYVKDGKNRRLKFWDLRVEDKIVKKLDNMLKGKRLGEYVISEVRKNKGRINSYSSKEGDIVVMLHK